MPGETATRKVLTWFFRRTLGIYFREIEIAGNLPPVETHGRVFVSNHNNLLLDPLLVLTTARCVISPVAKSTLWNKPALRWLMEQAAAVPIVRRRDDPGKQAGVNDEVFDKVASALGDGGNILIFPEGTSHNEP
jgi:1-acyl-sn-glycerol-3-phosphate acyltransferase